MRTPEIWKEIGRSPKGRKVYYISNMGRCRTVDRVTGDVRTNRGGVNKATGYYIFPSVGEYVHRLVAKAFIDNPNPDVWTEVDHINSIKSCNRASNLRWISVADNRHRLHKRRSQSSNFSRVSHKGEMLVGENRITGETRCWANGGQCATDIGCSLPLVYNSINHRQSARSAKQWLLHWEPIPEEEPVESFAGEEVAQ